MLFWRKSRGTMLNQNEVLPSLTNEMFVYWKRILYYNNLLKKEELEVITFDQLLNHLSRISYSKIEFTRYQIKLCLELLFFILLCFSPRKLQNNKELSLIYGLSDDQIFRSGTTVELLNFLQSSRVGMPLNNLIYIERKSYFPHKNHRGSIKLVSNISLYLFLDYLKPFDRLKVLLLVFKRFFSYIRNISRAPYFFLIAVPYVIEEVLFSYISTNSLVKASSVATTQSSLMNHEYIFQLYKKFGKRTMIWYSANSIPIEYLESTLSRVTFDTQIYKYTAIEEHLVWTEDHRDYLKTVVKPGTSIKVCGSLMFYLPKIESKNPKTCDLLIFDITPYNENRTTNNSKYPDSFNTIYTPSHAIKFLEDILWVKKEISLRHSSELKLALKPKRNYTSAHDTMYTDYLNSLAETKQLKLVSPETNLYEIIVQSKVCISYPFASPAIIAEELKVPSLYYLESDILSPYNKVHGINFVDTKLALLKFVEKFVIGGLQ